MPVRRIGRRRPMRRMRRRRNRLFRRKNRFTSVVRSGLGTLLPPRLITKMKYYNNQIFTTIVTGVYSSNLYNLNSIFDPDRTGVGRYPMGYNQITPFYQHYRVFKTSWTVLYQGTSGRYRAAVIPVNGDAAPFTTFDEAVEQPRAMVKVGNFNGGPSLRFKGKIYLPNLAGASSVRYRSDDRFEANITASPAEIMTLHVGATNDDAGAISMNVVVILVYHVEFYDPNTLPTSTV